MSTETTPTTEVRPPESRQFDFWLGSWDLTWGEDGRGTNVVSKILDGQVVQEQFTGEPSTPYYGLSLSVYDGQAGCWQQTWVDSQGAYLDFRGGWEADSARMVLSRPAVVDGQPVRQRMVWYNITADSLEWCWERSADDGATWQTLWHIRYRRRADPR